MRTGRPKGSKTHNGKCNKCSVDLIVGENWRASSKKSGNHNCSLCSNKLSIKYQKANPDIRNNILPGIYSIYNHDEIIYIGESTVPFERKGCHFSVAGKLGGKITDKMSAVSLALGRGELQRENLTFKMLEFIDDTATRKQQESLLIQRHSPRYNSDIYSHIQ
tara:strand:+ start:200 stop:688 length:489 start_codon:yes stop_codon:yes gene_type:complete